MNIDGEAALRCWAVTVAVAGRQHRISPHPASVWLPLVTGQDWLGIVPGLLDDPRPVDDAFFDGAVSYDELVQVAQAAVTEAAGCPWWSAVRLLAAGLDEPKAMGALALAPLDFTTAPLGAVVLGMYHLYTRHATRIQQARLDAELDKPPAGVPAAQRFNEDEMADAFERMYSARGGR